MSRLGLVLMALCAFLACGAVTRQGASVPGGAAGGRLAAAKDRFSRLAQALNLTDTQQQQLKAIFRDDGQKLKSLRAQTGLTLQQRRAQHRQIRQDLVARVKAVLTPEQCAKWLKLRAGAHARHHPTGQL